MSGIVTYCKDEIRTVRGYLEGRITPKGLDKPLLEKLMKEKQHLVPFFSFAKDEKGLFEKIASDPRSERFSYLMFFPVLENHLDYDMRQISFEMFDTRTRGWAAKLNVEGRDVIIKPIQSIDEPYVAGYAGANNAGPLQYPTLGGFITEEFMAGDLFNRISQGMNEELASFVGQRVGTMLGTLHKGRIMFNDVIFADDFGGCHLMVRKNDARMLDFGVSLDLSKFPTITDEQIKRYMLTLPLVGGMMQGLGEDALHEQIQHFRNQVSGADVKALLSRDMDFVSEGLYFSRFRSAGARDALAKSLFDAYDKAKQEG